MRMHRWTRRDWLAALAATLILPTAALRAQEPTREPRPEPAPDPIAEAVTKIVEEGTEHSQVMETLSYLTDVVGPRLTGSPNMVHANQWTRETLESWGLVNAAVEPWGTFGRGWSLDSFCAQVVEPDCIPLIAMPKAWSPGTDGPITGKVVLFDAETIEDFDRFEGKLEGAIVLVGTEREVAAHFEAEGSRYGDDRLLALANALPPGEGPRRGGFRGGRPQINEEQMAAFRARQEVAARRDSFLMEQKAAAVVDCSSRGDGGTLFVQSASVPRDPDADPADFRNRPHPWDPDAPAMLPQLTMAVEHFNRLVRMIRHGVEPVMQLELKVTFHDEDLTAANTVAEIPGSDPELAPQVVMLGGHLDSWHGSTGATDNAAGCAVAMEAVRIIKALDLKPRRTIRIALWSGEEQGLYGSRNYVSQHFGARNDEGELETTDAYDDFAAYYNLDNGTGKIRGIYLQGNLEAGPIFRRWLVPFAEQGASTVTPGNTGGTDHQSFDGIGLPGFQFIQDPVEYNTRTHHSNMDSYERAQADDLKQASVIMATFVYRTAMMDEPFPRKSADDGR